MITIRKRLLTIILSFSLVFILLLSGCSNDSKTEVVEDYPTKPVQVIIAFGPGGETDIVGRLVLNHAQEYFGQDFVVINKPGASGEVGWGELAQAEPDGYTLGMVNPPTFVQLPIKNENTAYKIDQFIPISNVSSDPGAIVVLNDFPADTLNELVEMAKENPGSITVGTGGSGTSESLALYRISRETGAEFTEVPFGGTAEMSASLQGGHIDVAVMNISVGLGLIEQGVGKVIGVGSLSRDEHLPEVPTYIEQGINVEQFAMRGFVAPAGTDMEIVKKIDEAIARVFEDEEFLKKAKDANLLLDYQNYEEFNETLQYLDRTNREEWESNPWE